MAGINTNVDPSKASNDAVSSHAPNMWLVNGNNISNTSSGAITMGNSMVETSSCPLAPMLDSFCPPIWDQPINGQSLGYCNTNAPNDPGTLSSLGHLRVGMSWMPNAELNDVMFLPSVSRMHPHSLPPFPADSAFIERAARFSCFSGGSFSEMVNPFSIPDPLNSHFRSVGPTQGPDEVFNSDRLKQSPGIESQKHETNTTDVSKDASLPGKHEIEGSQFKNKKKSESFMPSHDEDKNGVDVSSNQSDGAEFSGRGDQEELFGTAGESFGNGLGLKKRKRTEEKTESNENNEAPQPDTETADEKGDQNPSSTNNLGGKHGKQESQVSDPPKEGYIHVRARRGQATNSHSLAERIRREKISERMKFLQDLVPGCSKVTGKAVMLDEIINYVQSLQRQVEFLSMKLATVNPRLDFNMEGFLAKDILQPRAGLPPSLPFPPDITMPFPPLHLPQPGLSQAGLPGTRISSEALYRPIGLEATIVCGGLRESTSQAPSVWEDELNNVVHKGFNSSASLNTQDSSGHMKAEP